MPRALAAAVAVLLCASGCGARRVHAEAAARGVGVGAHQNHEHPNTSTTPSTRTPAASSFDYYLFVRQWDPSICDAMRCGPRRPHSDAFTIHGLWPERADGSWPQYCGRPDSWSPADLAPLLPRLRAAWPSFGPATPDPDPAFWAHEWLRHGTCAERLGGGGVGGPRAFFEAVLGLDAALPLGPALAAAGIAPGGGGDANATYAVSAIEAAVGNATGSAPAVRCGPPRSRARGELSEIWVCLAKGTLDVMDCPANVRRGSGCPGGRVALPSLVRGGGGGGGRDVGMA
jgi:ribonuclease T2